MATNPCFESVREIVGDISDRELDDLVSELRKEQRTRTAADDLAGLENEAFAAADRIAKRKKEAAIIQKRNVVLGRLAYVRGLRDARQYDFDLREGMDALTVGSQRVRMNARRSVYTEQQQFLSEFAGGFIADMERDGLWQAFVSRAFESDIADALWRLDDPNAKFDDLAPEAVSIAKHVHKYQDMARLTQNRFGAWIGKTPGYIVKQSHDMHKIRKVSKDAWKDDIRERLDWDKIAEDNADELPADRAKFKKWQEQYLDDTYDALASGVHLSDRLDSKNAAFDVGANVAKRASQARKLHFNSAKDWKTYNDLYGEGPLHEAVLLGFHRSARAAGLMKQLGPNPEHTLRQIHARLTQDLKDADPKTRERFESYGRNKMPDRLAQVDGTVNVPGNATAARIDQWVLALQALSKLGAAVVSAVSDIPIYAADVKTLRGGTYFSGMAEAIGGLVRGRPTGERREVLSSLGVFHDSMANGAMARFDVHDMTNPRGATQALNFFFKWNGLSWWTETLRDANALMNAHFLAQQRGKGWADLQAETQRTLTQYGVDEPTWDLIRQGVVKLADGREYFTSDGLKALPDDAVRAYLQGQGRKTITDRTIQNTKDDLAGMMRGFYLDRATTAVIEPDARTRAFLLQGTRPGKGWGRIARYVAQFKGFPTAVLQKAAGRQLFGSGSDTLSQALRNGNGEIAGLIKLLGATTLFGYAAMSIKDLLRGKEPREISPTTALQAMLQGGALGIYGDFLIGQSDRFGRSLLDTLAGPTLGTISDLDSLRASIIRTTTTEETPNIGSSLLRLVTNNTPFANHYLLRPMMDYLFLYDLQESLNPGYLRRMERRALREQNQEYLFPPSTDAARPLSGVFK